MNDEVNASPQMSSAAEHISLDELADAAERLLADDRAAQVRAHVAACTRCAEAEAALTHTRSALTEEPTPAMPAAVFDRLNRVVEAEVERRRAGGSQAEADVEQAARAKRSVGNFGQHPDFDRKWSPEQVRRGDRLSRSE